MANGYLSTSTGTPIADLKIDRWVNDSDASAIDKS